MSFGLIQFLRRSFQTWSLHGLLVLPVVVSSGGMVLLLGYLAQQGTLETDLVLLGLGPLGGAIALTWLIAYRVTQRFTDLEQRYQDAHTSMGEQERWLQQYSQLSPGNIYILVQTPEGRVYFEYMSLAIEAIHEISVDQILQDANILFERIHPDDQQTYEQAVRQSAEQLTPFSHQWRVITPFGQVKWLQANSQPELRKNGDIAWYGVVIDITGLKQAETALVENEKRYRAILNAIPDLILRMDRGGTYLDIKPTDAFATLVTPEDVGRNMAELLPEDVVRQRLDAIAEVLKTGEMQVFEVPLQIQGELVWDELRILPLSEDEVVLIIRDLSQRRQMEAALRQSEANLVRAQHIAKVGSWELDPATGAMEWSEELFHIFGLDPAQAAPRYPDILDYLPAEERSILGSRVDRAMADHVSYKVEHCIWHADGTARWVVSRGQMIYNQALQQFRLCGTMLDITERKQTEMALQESEARFRQLAETVKEGFFVFDTDTAQYSYLNPAILDLTGTPRAPSPDEPPCARGMSHWFNNIHPDDRPHVEAKLQEERGGEPFDVEYRFLHPDGRLLWLRSRAFPLEDATGKTVRIVGTVENITDRKQLEDSLRSQAKAERMLSAITQNIRQSLDLDDILATTVSDVQQSLNADQVLIFRLHPNGSAQVIQAAVKAEYPITDQMCWKDQHYPPEMYEYYLQDNPRIVANVNHDRWADYLDNYLRHSGVKSKIVAPIVHGLDTASQRVWGLLMVHACAHYRQWQETEADLLQRLSNQLAIAIDQANLFQQLQAELAERKQAEAALQERERLLRAIGDHLPKGFVYQLVHEPGEGFYFNYVSAGIEQVVGLKPEDIVGNFEVLDNLILEEDRPLVKKLNYQSLETLSLFEFEMRRRTLWGDIQWSFVRSVPHRLEDGRTIWYGVEIDITNLKHTEAALKDSEELFRRAFDDAPIGISLIAPDGKFLKANHYYCNLLGYTEEELLRMHFQDFTHPDDLEADLAGLAKMRQGEIQTFQMEKRYISKQGEIIPVFLNASLIRDDPGNPLYSVGHIQDIRDRLEVDRIKDEFVSIVSHELRTPITSIEGSLMLIGSGVYDTRPEKAKAMLDIAIKNSNRLVRLVDDILSFERLESGKVQLTMEPCQVEDLMQQAIDSVRTLADQAAVTVAMISCPATIHAAPDFIVQALTNLLSNAIKFSEPRQTVWVEAIEWEGGRVDEWEGEHGLKAGSQVSGTQNQLSPSTQNPKPKIQNSNLETPNPSTRQPIYPSTSSILFSVTDQGRGIPAEKLESIFDQFQQVDVSDSRKKGGTGLGLAICKRIIEQHGGEIWVESELGQGSVFCFTVPVGVKDKG